MSKVKSHKCALCESGECATGIPVLCGKTEDKRLGICRKCKRKIFKNREIALIEVKPEGLYFIYIYKKFIPTGRFIILPEDIAFTLLELIYNPIHLNEVKQKRFSLVMEHSFRNMAKLFPSNVFSKRP